MREFAVPRVAIGDEDEMLLSTWAVEEGQPFADGDPLLEIETDKAAIEVEADRAGVLALRLRELGSRVAPGQVIALIADPGEEYDIGRLRARYAAVASAATTGADAAAADDPAAAQPLTAATIPGGMAANGGDRDPAGRTNGAPAVAAAPDPASVEPPHHHSAPAAAGGAAVRPPVAAAAGNGTAAAPGLRPPAAEAVVAPAPAAAAPGFSAPGLFYGLPARRRPTAVPVGPIAAAAMPAPGRAPVREPLSRHRRALARLMTASAAIPQFSVHRELPMAGALRTVAALRRAGVAATVTDVLLRATALALVRHPELDGCLVDDAVEHAGVPAISLTADSPSGVVAPVVRGAERLPWRQLALERKRVVDGARRGRLLPADLTGGTFSISNVGALGGDLVIPMLTPPQIGILGVGRARPEWGGTVAGAVLVADHRAVDGADSARFLATLADLLADPDDLEGGDG